VSPSGVIGVVGFDAGARRPTLTVLNLFSGDVLTDVTLDRGSEIAPPELDTDNFSVDVAVDPFGNFLVGSAILNEDGGFSFGEIVQTVSPTGEIFATEVVA